MPLFEPVFAALDAAGSRYVVVGGELAPDWAAATWEGARARRLRRQATVASPAQRLRWLEEALELVFQSAVRRPSDVGSPPEVRSEVRSEVG